MRLCTDAMHSFMAAGSPAKPCSSIRDEISSLIRSRATRALRQGPKPRSQHTLHMAYKLPHAFAECGSSCRKRRTSTGTCMSNASQLLSINGSAAAANAATSAPVTVVLCSRHAVRSVASCSGLSASRMTAARRSLNGTHGTSRESAVDGGGTLSFLCMSAATGSAGGSSTRSSGGPGHARTGAMPETEERKSWKKRRVVLPSHTAWCAESTR
mmetsp:Transcript_16991/g.28344  ORF Transcript_16991/g.28344 Transcript_16991/m.28344 type:complete len:213 (-) Transcript_16991:475-1113(-)